MRGNGGERRPRLDQLIVDRGLAPNRTRARALVLAGRITSGGTRVEKPGARIDADVPLELVEGPRWVSRAGAKLAGALDELQVSVAGRDVLDVGASTGGFTHVLLERGAGRVAALDVGRGQLDWSLRNDPRVQALEGVNARHLEPGRLPFAPSLAVVDVSFISLRLVLPAVAACMDRPGEIVALVKPQFEVGRESVGRGGIVRDPRLHRRVLEDLAPLTLIGLGRPVGVCASALPGATGNREFFLHWAAGRTAPDDERLQAAIARAVGVDAGGATP